MMSRLHGGCDSKLFWSNIVAGGLLFFAIVPVASAGESGRSPSRVLPSNGLYAYVEYDGLAAHSTAWKATAAYEVLGKTSAGAMLTDVARQLIDALSRNAPGRKFLGAEIIAIQQHLVDHGFALACYDEKGPTSKVLVVKAVGKTDSKKLELVRKYVLMPDEAKALPASTPQRGRAIFRFGNQQESDRDGEKNGRDSPAAAVGLELGIAGVSKLLSAWFEGDQLVIVQGPDPDLLSVMKGDVASQKDLADRHKARVTAVLDAIDGKQATVSALPAYLAASTQARDLTGFEPNGLFLVESKKESSGILSVLFSPADLASDQPSERNVLETFGLDRARRVVGRWGFRGKSLLTDIRFEAEEPWNRVGGMLNPPRIHRDGLPPIPDGAGAFAVGSFRQVDLRKSFAPLWPMVRADVRPILEAAEKTIVGMTTSAFRDEVFRHLGPTWCVYAAAGARPDANGSADPAFLVEVDDSEAAAKLLDELVSRANAYFREQRPGDGPAAMSFERLPSPERGYRLTSPARAVPWLSDRLQPTVLLGKSFIAMAANPALARAAIAGETLAASRFTPAGELARSLNCLPEKLSLLIVGNPRDSFWSEAIADFPSKAGPFLSMFLGLPAGALTAEPQATDLLGLLGVKRAKAPTAGEILDQLYPSVIAAIVDDRSFRFIAIEALPFAFLGPELKYDEKGPSKEIDIDFKFRPGK